MNGVLLVSRCLLAAVFLVAAVGKVLDPPGSRRALQEFGVPLRFVSAGAVLLPAAEVAAAVALLVAPSARWGALLALLLLVMFAAAVARAMANGQAPDCHCFGQLHSEPAGRSTLIRNGLLAIPAVIVIAWGPGPSLTAALGALHGAQIGLVVTSVLAAVLALVAAQLWSERQRMGRELRAEIAAKAPPGLPPGTLAPEFTLEAVRGTTSSLGELLSGGRPTVLVFVSTTCGPCLAMLSTLSRWQETLAERLTIAATFAGDRDEVSRLSDEHGLGLVISEEQNFTFELFRLRVTPSAVLIGPDGKVLESPAEGQMAIEALIRAALARSGPAPALVPGA